MKAFNKMPPRSSRDTMKDLWFGFLKPILRRKDYPTISPVCFGALSTQGECRRDVTVA